MFFSASGGKTPHKSSELCFLAYQQSQGPFEELQNPSHSIVEGWA